HSCGITRTQVARLPTFRHELVLEERGITNHVATYVRDTGIANYPGECIHGSIRPTPWHEARGKRRIAGTAEIQVALNHIVFANGAVVQQIRAEAVLRTERVERKRCRVQFHRGRRHHVCVCSALKERVSARERHYRSTPLPISCKAIEH